MDGGAHATCHMGNGVPRLCVPGGRVDGCTKGPSGLVFETTRCVLAVYAEAGWRLVTRMTCFGTGIRHSVCVFVTETEAGVYKARYAGDGCYQRHVWDVCCLCLADYVPSWCGGYGTARERYHRAESLGQRARCFRVGLDLQLGFAYPDDPKGQVYRC